jgi:N-acetyl-alpha-D-muramate 1-phosphate uridylyltransferase
MSKTYPYPEQRLGHHAMVLAAGLGLRMRPLTDHTPKPLVHVSGRPLIEYGMDRLREAGVESVVVNAHYLADQIVTWAQQQPPPGVIISDERAEVLDTGGGIAKAMALLGEDPFFVLNSDSFWIDGGKPALRRLMARWNDVDMDCLLLLCPVEKTIGYDGSGDFLLAKDGRIVRQRGSGALAYIGGYLVHPRLFKDSPSGKFSMNVLWDRAIAKGRLFGISHDGVWLHVGTPDGLRLAEAELAKT